MNPIARILRDRKMTKIVKEHSQLKPKKYTDEELLTLHPNENIPIKQVEPDPYPYDSRDYW